METRRVAKAYREHTDSNEANDGWQWTPCADTFNSYEERTSGEQVWPPKKLRKGGDWERTAGSTREHVEQPPRPGYTGKIRKVETLGGVGRTSIEGKNSVHMKSGENKQSRRTGTDSNQEKVHDATKCKQRKGYLGRMMPKRPTEQG